MRYKFGREPRTEALRASALNVFGSWLADRRSRDLSAGAELSHARKLASAGSGLQELYLLQLVASLDERRGAYSSAEAEWRTALLRLEQVPHTEQTRLAIQGNLAVTLRKAGDALQARDLQTKVLERRTELLGPKHAETIESLDNLGVTLAALGDFAGAISRHEQAVSLYSEVRGPGDPDTLVAMANLASALRRGGRVKEALELNTKLLELRAKVLGPNHPGTLCAAEGLAVSLSELGQPTQALPLLKAAAEGLEQVRGPDDPTTLSVRHNLGRALIETGQGQEGHALAAEVFDRQERVLGLSHPDTLLTLETCVFAGREPGHLVYDPRFKSKAAEALKALSSSMGPKHPRTTACAWDLYLMLESDPNRRTETVALVDSYLAWLLTTPPQELEASQRTILGQFARTEDGLFRLVVARLSPGGKT